MSYQGGISSRTLISNIKVSRRSGNEKVLKIVSFNWNQLFSNYVICVFFLLHYGAVLTLLEVAHTLFQQVGEALASDWKEYTSGPFKLLKDFTTWWHIIKELFCTYCNGGCHMLPREACIVKHL